MNIDIDKMLSLKPSYNKADKDEWRRRSRQFLRAVVAGLGLAKGSYEVRFCEGGIAVSGDAILHTDTVYVSMNLDGFCSWILVRSCKGRKDYTGGRNQSYTFDLLRREGLDGFVAWLKRSGLVVSHAERAERGGP